MVQCLPETYQENLLEFQWYVIMICKNGYSLDAIGNADKMLVFFDMPGDITFNNLRAYIVQCEQLVLRNKDVL